MRLLLTLLLLFATSVGAQEHSFKPAIGFVPDESTAVAVGLAVLTPIYGIEKLKRQHPFKAKLQDGYWHVQGSIPAEQLGGVAEIWIAKADAHVKRVTHGQ
jgi:hypothetical protein